MKNKLGLFEWNAFQNEEGWRFSFGYIFPCARDIQVFASSKLANWRLKQKFIKNISMNNWTMELKQVWCPSCVLNRHFKQKGIRYLPHTQLIPWFHRCAFSRQWSRFYNHVLAIWNSLELCLNARTENCHLENFDHIIRHVFFYVTISHKTSRRLSRRFYENI